MIEWGEFGKKAIDFMVNPIQKDARINILEGSVRSGKTVCMIYKLLDYVKNGPKGLMIITGVSKDTIYDNVLLDLFDTVGDEYYSYNRQTGELNLYGRRLKIIGAKDEGSEKYLRGKTLAGAYCDELSLMPEKFFKQLLNRLSIKGAKLYGTTNPDSPSHYLYTEFINSHEKLLSGMVKIIHFTLDDNPNLDDEYKNYIRAAYSGFWYDRMILGKWVVAQGAIYDMFDDVKNTYQDGCGPNYDLWHRRYIAIDYGTTNPCVFLEVIEQDGIYYVEKEYYYDSKVSQRQKEDSEYAEDLIKFIDGKNYVAVIVDPSAASFKVTARRKGIRIKDADNEVLDGIRLTASMFALGRLKLNKDSCTNGLREIKSYVWDDKASERGEEKPTKQNDHFCDALRYLVRTIIKIIPGTR